MPRQNFRTISDTGTSYAEATLHLYETHEGIVVMDRDTVLFRLTTEEALSFAGAIKEITYDKV